MAANTTDQPFYEDLEHGCSNQGVQKTESGIVKVPETAHTDLTDQEDEDWYEDCQHRRCPDRDDLMAKWV